MTSNTDVTPRKSSVLMTDVVIAGAGVVGLSAAIVLARGGATVTVVAPRPLGGPTSDWRTAALFLESVAFLEFLGAWEAMKPTAAELRGIRMVDRSDRLLRAPQVLFDPAEIGLARFGFNVANSDIVRVLEAIAARTDGLTRISARVVDADLADSAGSMRLFTESGEEVRGRIAIAADGRHSLLRTLAGIGTRSWDDGQVAITSRFAHQRPHAGISTEFHYEAGPCTCVPLSGNASSLVWLERSVVAARLMRGDGDGLRSELQARFAPLLGPLSDVLAPRAVPLSGLVATRFGGRRVLLVGETAHAFPPIGAQGLNLGLRDAAEAAGVIIEVMRSGGDPGGDAAIAAYHRRRWADINARTVGVRALNASLTRAIPLLDLARGAGLHVANGIPALRRDLMRRGMSALGSTPALMIEAKAASVECARARLDGDTPASGRLAPGLVR